MSPSISDILRALSKTPTRNPTFHLAQYLLITPPVKISPPSFRQQFYNDWPRVLSLSGTKLVKIEPPQLEMPLTVEPSKPRLCNDDRFLNLWMGDKPFSLDDLSMLPCYVPPYSFQTVCDDKLGYDHIFLTESSRIFFGFEWADWFFNSNTIPFGWKLSAYIYHNTGLLASHFFRSIATKASSSCWIVSVCKTPTTHSPLKSKLISLLPHLPVSLYVFISCDLGIALDWQSQPLPHLHRSHFWAFSVTQKHNRFVFYRRRRKMSCSSRWDSLPEVRFSFTLAVPGARLFTNEINLAIARSGKSKKPIEDSGPLREEIQHWLFLRSWAGYLPWRDEKHVQVRLASDASSYSWGGVSFSCDAIQVSIHDCWPPSLSLASTVVKETLAVSNVLKSFLPVIRNCWVNIMVDSKSFMHAWRRQGSRSNDLCKAMKEIFYVLLDANCSLSPHYVPSTQNPANASSRSCTLQDATIAPHVWSRIQGLVWWSSRSLSRPHGSAV